MKSHAAIAAVCARFAGLAMIGASLPELGYLIGRTYKRVATGTSITSIFSPFVDSYDTDIFNWLGWLMLGVLGAYLLLGGRLITRILIRPLLANCQSCGYPLTSIKATRCPECGHENAKA